MFRVFDQSAPEGAPPDESESAQPVGQADLDKFKDELLGTLKSDFDTRFSGFQQIIAKRDQRIDQLESTLSELKTADLSDDERVQLEKDALAQERAAIAAERELLALQKDYPDEVEFYKTVLDQPSAKDQIALLHTWRKPAENQVPEPTPDEGATSSDQSAVDPNNPAAETTDGLDYQAQFERDPGLADRLLKGANRLSGR